MKTHIIKVTPQGLKVRYVKRIGRLGGFETTPKPEKARGMTLEMATLNAGDLCKEPMFRQISFEVIERYAEGTA